MVDNSAGNSKESKKPEINVKIFTFFFLFLGTFSYRYGVFVAIVTCLLGEMNI